MLLRLFMICHLILVGSVAHAAPYIDLQPSINFHISFPTTRSPVRGGVELSLVALAIGEAPDTNPPFPAPVFGGSLLLEGSARRGHRATQLQLLGHAGLGVTHSGRSLAWSTFSAGYAFGWGEAATGVYMGGRFTADTFLVQPSLGVGGVLRRSDRKMVEGRVHFGIGFPMWLFGLTIV